MPLYPFELKVIIASESQAFTFFELPFKTVRIDAKLNTNELMITQFYCAIVVALYRLKPYT